jgi:hypothetical protein
LPKRGGSVSRGVTLVESLLHKFLKKVGVAFLLNQDCFLVDTEVVLSGVDQLHSIEGHRVIDVCGVGERFFKAQKRSIREFKRSFSEYEVKKNVLRGIEVKVSRADFKNGFISSCCNFNYLITPMRMVASWELPKEVGLIEYNKYKFSVVQDEKRKFMFKGIKVIRKATFKKLRQFQVDNTIAYIAKRSIEKRMDKIFEELNKNHNEIN